MSEDVEIENTGSPMENQDIMTMIDFTAASNYNKATEIFNDMLAHRVDDALEQKKIAMANKTFNGIDDEEEEQLEFDLDDEDEVDLDDEDEVDAEDVDAEDLSDEEIEDAVDEMESEEEVEEV